MAHQRLIPPPDIIYPLPLSSARHPSRTQTYVVWLGVHRRHCAPCVVSMTTPGRPALPATSRALRSPLRLGFPCLLLLFPMSQSSFFWASLGCRVPQKPRAPSRASHACRGKACRCLPQHPYRVSRVGYDRLQIRRTWPGRVATPSPLHRRRAYLCLEMAPCCVGPPTER